MTKHLTTLLLIFTLLGGLLGSIPAAQAAQVQNAEASIGQFRPQTRFGYRRFVRHHTRYGQGRCLGRLIARESGWNRFARNPYSGAYGIPQALPGSKMAVVAGDWSWNGYTQIRWMLRYVRARYGSPCVALAHSYRYGWY